MTDRTPRTPASLVIYDLDGVITTRDTFTALVARRLLRAPHRLLRALPAVAKMLLGDENQRHGAARKAAHIALAGLDGEQCAKLARQLGEAIGRDPRWVRGSVVERIRQQKREGRAIVIATATERQLAQSLLAEADIPYDVLSASEVLHDGRSLRFKDHRVGERKLESLREQGIPIEVAEFVTDSYTDAPTARAAGRVTLIGSSAKTRARYAADGLAFTTA